MMRTMRALAKWIMGVVALAFVGFMIFEVGMDATGRGTGRGQVIARVNGAPILAQVFQVAVRNEFDRIRQQGGQAPVSLAGQRDLENRVLEQLIQETLLQQEYARRGITVTDEEVVAAAQTTPPPEVLELEIFQTDSQFDFDKYRRYLASNADPQFLLGLEALYRQEIPRIKLIEQVTAGVYVPDAALWRQWRDRHDSVTAEVLALFPAAAVPDSAVSVTEADARAWYAAHEDALTRPARAFLSFVAVPRRPNAADSAAAAERARRVHQEILDGGDFAEIARRVSADSVSGAQGGDLGVQRLGAFVPAFEQAALALRPGAVSAPVSSRFGWHIIRLDARTDTTFHAAHILIPIEPVGEHLDRIERRADTLDLYVAERPDGSQLDRIAEALELPVAQAPPLDEGDRLELGRFVLADPGVWAFGPDALPGGTSPVVETEWAYYVFRLDSVAPAGLPPFPEVREQAERGARRERKLAEARRMAAAIARDARQGGPLPGAVTVGPFTRLTPPPVLQGAAEAVGVAFGQGVGQVSAPLETSSAVYVVRTLRRIPADSLAWRAQLDAQRADAIRTARQERLQAVFASLRSAARVEDYRDELAQLQREAEEQGLLPGIGNPLGF